MNHKFIPLVLVVVGMLVAVIFATSAVQPNPASAEYPPPPRPPIGDPNPPSATTVPRSGGGSGSSPDLELVQVLSTNILYQGDQVEITLTARHISGSNPAEDVLVFIELPAFFSIVSAQTTGSGLFSIQGEQISVRVPVIFEGDEVVTTIVGLVDEPPTYTLMQLTGSVSSITPESNLDNNQMGQMLVFPCSCSCP